MRRGWLIPLTRVDGRSLMRALAALLFINAFVAGVHSGFAAAPGVSGAVICHVAPDGSGPAPAADHERDCCLAATAPAALQALPPAGGGAAMADRFAPAPEGQTPHLHGAANGAGPRAPPSLPA